MLAVTGAVLARSVRAWVIIALRITVGLGGNRLAVIAGRVIEVLRVVRCERRTPLTANVDCWRAWPMGIHATLMLTPRCSPWRSAIGASDFLAYRHGRWR